MSNEEACTGGELIMLNAFLTSYDAFVASISLDDLSYPLRLNTVQFCNGVQRILLDDNLNILGNVAYRIISQQWVADKENAIILLDGGQISTGTIEDLFDAIPGNDDLSVMVEDESPGSPAAYDPIDPVTVQDPDKPVMEVTTPISYYLHDHLGNTRMIIRADDPSAMTITYAADYYPYGKILREWSPCEPERFLTTQHERDSESGYDNRGARLYDADVGQGFLSVDPLAQSYTAYSGYNYVLGNPNSFIDPDGRMAIRVDGQEVSGAERRYWENEIKEYTEGNEESSDESEECCNGWGNYFLWEGFRRMFQAPLDAIDRNTIGKKRETRTSTGGRHSVGNLKIESYGFLRHTWGIKFNFSDLLNPGNYGSTYSGGDFYGGPPIIEPFFTEASGYVTKSTATLNLGRGPTIKLIQTQGRLTGELQAIEQRKTLVSLRGSSSGFYYSNSPRSSSVGFQLQFSSGNQTWVQETPTKVVSTLFWDFKLPEQ